MNMKKGLQIVGGIIVGGIIIAGEVLGWDTFLPSFSSPTIKITPTSRTASEEIFVDEKIWITLSDVETDHVYWVFDEGDDVIHGGIQLQYTFPFNSKLSRFATSKRRVDAFYKIGDDYKHVLKRITLINIKFSSELSFGPQGLTFKLPTELPGEWKLGDVRLTRLSEGEFQDFQIEPESVTANNDSTLIIWNSKQVAVGFGYVFSEEGLLNLMLDRKAWVSAEYLSQNSEEKLTLIKALAKKDKR